VSTDLPKLRHWLDELLERRALSTEDAQQLLVGMTDPDLPPSLAGALLAAVRAKGVTPEELRGFALGMRSLARRPNIRRGIEAVDIVGTGGDKSGSFNISTGASLLTAAAACLSSSMATARCRAGQGALMCSKHWACPCRWMKSRPRNASPPRISPSCSHRITTRR